ncbi:MAG TPA: anaerobic ribonucleoside-triphosphate reductase activating protein [bacterium]|nr:anaerobic ribonucleoside-triphosphate reductase activating protein [bacterium]
MQIGGLQKLTLIDYPGKVSCTVFLIGCNFRCPWCYSSELVLPKKIIEQPKISEEEFFEFLKKRNGLLDGVCVCGGEPTINKDILEFIKKIKKLRFFVKLDTNGSNPKILKELINKNLIDYVAMDIKGPKEKYKEITGGRADIKKIEESVKILKQNKIDYEFRTTIVPGFLKKQDFIKIAKWIGGSSSKYYLQNFKPSKTLDPEFSKLKPYTDEYLDEIQKAIFSFFEICKIRK